jgi:hypothetical protein
MAQAAGSGTVAVNVAPTLALPVRGLNTGEKVVHKVRDGDDAAAVARRLKMEIYRMLRGENSPGTVKGFGRQFDYPKSSLVVRI